MSFAYPLDAAPPARGLSARSAWLIGAAFLFGWGLYAVPAARAKAEAIVAPWVGGVEAPVRFGEVHARRGLIDGQPVLFVEGALLWSGKGHVKSPTLRVALIGDDGRPVYSWTAKPAKPELAAETPFRTRLLAPPEKFERIEVSLKRE